MEINITNKDLKELLLQYNITDRDIKGSGKNGGVLKADREREYLLLQKLEDTDIDEFVIIDDLLYQILLQTNINDMENLCMINKNAIKICHNKHFWIEKLNKDYINYDLPLPTTIRGIIKMIKETLAIKIAQSIIDVYAQHIYIEFDNDIIPLYNLFKIPLNMIVDPTLFKKVSIFITKILNNTWTLRFAGTYKDKRKKTYHDGLLNITNEDIIKYLAMIIRHFPEVNIFTDWHKTISYYDLIKHN